MGAPRPPPVHHHRRPLSSRARAAQHDLASYMALLGTNGKLVMVGLPPEPLELAPSLVVPREWRAGGGAAAAELPASLEGVCCQTLARTHTRAGRKLVAGSMMGGIRETQEMLDYCGEHGITCDIERIGIDDINAAMDRLARNDVRWGLHVRAHAVAAGVQHARAHPCAAPSQVPLCDRRARVAGGLSPPAGGAHPALASTQPSSPKCCCCICAPAPHAHLACSTHPVAPPQTRTHKHSM